MGSNPTPSAKFGPANFPRPIVFAPVHRDLHWSFPLLRSSMPRFYLSPEEWSDAPTLSGDEAHHCLKVLRLKTGAPIEVFDGLGKIAKAEISSTTRAHVGLHLSAISQQPETSSSLQLAVGVPKGKSMELICQKAVELGVREIYPLTSDYGEVSAADQEKKLPKWRRILLEACKQSGQAYLPKLHHPRSASKFFAKASPTLKIIASLQSTETLSPQLVQNATSIVFAVGPEGDFSPDEYATAQSHGFTPMTLGPLTLRTETATFYLASVLQFLASQ